MRWRKPRERLLFAEELSEILKETEDNNDERAGGSDEKEPCAEDHAGAGQSNHSYRVQGTERRVQALGSQKAVRDEPVSLEAVRQEPAGKKPVDKEAFSRSATDRGVTGT
jgi:hypothetical protein